jgi:hypothetical protein
VCIQSCADGGAANGQPVQRPQRGGQHGFGVFELGDVAGKFLFQRQRGGVLQMGAADLDDAAERGGFFLQRRAQRAQRRQELPGNAGSRRDMHRGGEDVVGRLAEIDLVIRMHQPFRTAHTAEQFRSAVGEHLVHVHVALRAGTGLPYRQYELPVMLACQYFIRRLHDSAGLFLVQQSQIAVDQRSGTFHRRQREDDFLRHPLGRDMEILQRALRLRAPQPFRRNFDDAEGIAFCSAGHGAFLPVKKPLSHE